MEKEKYFPLLGGFLSGLAGFEELSAAIDDRLFELRQNPQETDEEHFLAGIELTVCEVKDGFRKRADLEEFVRSLLTPQTLEVVWDGEGPAPTIPVVLGSSNRNANGPISMAGACLMTRSTIRIIDFTPPTSSSTFSQSKAASR